MYQKRLKFWSIPWLHFHIYLFVLLPVPILQWPLAPGPGIQFLMNYEEQVNTPFSQATNEFHAGSDTRCDEENDFDAIFGIVLLPSHTHNYAQSFSTIGVGIFAFLSQEREREKKVFRNLQNNPSNVKVINLMFNFSSSSAPLTFPFRFITWRLCLTRNMLMAIGLFLTAQQDNFGRCDPCKILIWVYHLRCPTHFLRIRKFQNMAKNNSYFSIPTSKVS